ncbi:MAG: phosphoribosylformylglycinamidine synthase I [Ardenticatenaceae bacterium]
MSKKPVVLIPHAPGTNRDGDAARAVELAGGEPRIRLMNQLREEPHAFEEAQMLLLPGGFSYGDALSAGRRWALDLELFFQEELNAFVESGRRVLGICNGFQVLVKAGLLPAWDEGRRMGDRGRGMEDGGRTVTLTFNESGQFECRWVYLRANPASRATYLRSLEELIFCPVAHGEGSLQVQDGETLERLQKGGYVAFRYVDGQGRPAGEQYPLNPNGSVADIAGICNAHGNVLGLMPHPEDHIVPAQSPLGRGGQLGLALFQAMLREPHP